MAVTNMFRQRAVVEFLVKEGNSAGVIYDQLRGVYGDACMGASSVRRYPTPAWQLSFGIVRDANWSNFWKKGKRSVQLTKFGRSTIFVVRFVKNVGRKL
jgi:hypothetical protein